MRRARLKPASTDIYYHLYNRVCGHADERPFGPAEKLKFIRILHRLQQFYTVEVLAYQVMSNHFHLLVFAPAQPPSHTEVKRRFTAYYGRWRHIDDNPQRLDILAERMRDISCFMHALQQQFSMWYNRSRIIPRRGPLWAQRFKHTLLGGTRTIWACWRYIEMNAVRAGLARQPGDYRFSSFGAWSGSGQHPFDDNARRRLLPIMGVRSMHELKERLRAEFIGKTGSPPRHDNEMLASLELMDRRVKHWVDGLIIGSVLFVKEMISLSKGLLQMKPVLDEHTSAEEQSILAVYNI